MKVFSFYLTLALGLASLGASIALISVTGKNKHLQTELAQVEQKIQRGANHTAIVRNLLSDLGQLSVEHPRIKTLLENNGIEVTLREPAAAPEAEEAAEPTPEPTPAPTPRSNSQRNRSSK